MFIENFEALFIGCIVRKTYVAEEISNQKLQYLTSKLHLRVYMGHMLHAKLANWVAFPKKINYLKILYFAG